MVSMFLRRWVPVSPPQIITGMAGAIVSLTDEVTAISLTKVHKVSRQILVRCVASFFIRRTLATTWQFGLRLLFLIRWADDVMRKSRKIKV